MTRDAKQAGVNLALELLNIKVYPDYQADHTQWGMQVCRAVGSPRVKLLYDMYRMHKKACTSSFFLLPFQHCANSFFPMAGSGLGM